MSRFLSRTPEPSSNYDSMFEDDMDIQTDCDYAAGPRDPKCKKYLYKLLKKYKWEFIFRQSILKKKIVNKPHLKEVCFLWNFVSVFFICFIFLRFFSVDVCSVT